MIIKSEFKVDLFQMKHNPNPEGLLAAMKAEAAHELGRKLVEMFPYERDVERSWKGEKLPEISLNKEHEFTDLYRTEFMAIDQKRWMKMIHYLHDMKTRWPLTAPVIDDIINFLNEH